MNIIKIITTEEPVKDLRNENKKKYKINLLI